MKYLYIPESGPASDAYNPFKVMHTLFPEPVTTSRSARALTFPLPRPVLSLAEFAREYSWEVRTQYSQGRMPHSITGKPGVLKDLIGLRFGAHPMMDRQAYAVYSRPAAGGAWLWSSVMIWGPDLPPFAGCSVTHLRAYLMMCADSSAEALAMWVEDLKSIAANAVALRKARPKAPAKPREDHA